MLMYTYEFQNYPLGIKVPFIKVAVKFHIFFFLFFCGLNE